VFRDRHLHQLSKLSLDLSVLGAAYLLGFLIRFEGAVPAADRAGLLLSLPWVLLAQGLCLIAFRLPSRSWRQVSLLDAQSLLAALVIATGALVVVRLLPAGPWDFGGATGCGRIPLSVLAANLPLGFLGTVGLRTAVRLRYERAAPRRQGAEPPRVRTLLVGAGRAGAQVVEELAARPDLGIEPVGFLDDDPAKVGELIHGVRVLGTTADLERVVNERRAGQVLIAIGGLPGANVRRITRLCERCRVKARIIPGIPEMVEGRVNVSAMRDVALEDLLHRAPVQLDTQAVAACVRARRVLVTGAGGSIGSELCRVVCRFRPATLVLVEQAENSLFHVHRELRAAFPEVEVVPYVADICDAPRMREIFACRQPHVVLHAAAHKHVPLMEANPGEAVKNNVLGTRGLADLADAAGTGAFVLVSTDKAVNPVSAMGASKRIAELYVQSLAPRSQTRFMIVRFGNVLGSNGSVIPIFQEQLAQGGPLTITHPEMRRYFMTIPEACQLVLQAASMGRGGELFVLDMGEPVRILDLAHDLIRLSGLDVKDVDIEFVGLRPGEKLTEELSFGDEGLRPTDHPRIFVGQSEPRDWAALGRALDELGETAARGNVAETLTRLRHVVPEYRPNGSAVPEGDRAWLNDGRQLLPAPHAANGAGQRNGTAAAPSPGKPTLPYPNLPA
jgi:FlaA1/EpsC-like NDP-sugar epimerase